MVGWGRGCGCPQCPADGILGMCEGGARRRGPQSARPGRWPTALCLARVQDMAGPLLSAATAQMPPLT